jgi:hypothetical protein
MFLYCRRDVMMRIAAGALFASFILAAPASANYAMVSTCHIAAASSGGNAVTTNPGVDCSGVDLLVLTISYYTGTGHTSSPSDSSSNTWLTAKSQTQSTCPGSTAIYYVQNPSVTASQTFTASATGGLTYPSIQVQGFTGSTGTPLDVTNSATSGGSNVATKQPGSITPGQNGELVVSDVLWCPNGSGSGTTVSIDSGFTITDQNSYSPNNAEGGALAYIVQTTAAAVNPTWTFSTSSFVATAIASFKPASYTPPPADLRMRRGYGQ